MSKVTLKFPSLQVMAECIFQLGITRPVIDYEQCTLTAELSDKQIGYAKDCDAEILEQVIIQ